MKIVASIILMVVMVTPVLADCGWVLWSHKSGSVPDTWVIEDAEPEWVDCQIEKERTIKSELAVGGLDGSTKVRRMPGTSTVVISGGDGDAREVRIRYICLPGTLDPRPRG